jgi:hypothetical protein
MHKAIARKATLCAAMAGIALLSTAAVAGDGSLHCDDSGYHCYRVRRDDDDALDRWRGEVPWYGRYGDDDYDRGRHMVCDPDGDRCYLSRGWRWDYRQYYRLHGYRWND